MRKFKKANNIRVTKKFLNERCEFAKKNGYEKAKWIQFCEEILKHSSLSCTLYEARKTFSKYITITDGTQSFKVRFSNHRPIKSRELGGDCDFFVGVTNLSITRTEDALVAVFNFFHMDK